MEPMPMDQPPMGGPEDMGPGLDEQPPMGGEDPMDDAEMPEGNNAEGNGEIDDIFSQLDTEKQAAVIKYAKSMLGEGVESEKLVTEIENEILADRQDKEKKEKIRNKSVDKAKNPFVTKFN